MIFIVDLNHDLNRANPAHTYIRTHMGMCLQSLMLQHTGREERIDVHTATHTDFIRIYLYCNISPICITYGRLLMDISPHLVKSVTKQLNTLFYLRGNVTSFLTFFKCSIHM